MAPLVKIASSVGRVFVAGFIFAGVFRCWFSMASGSKESPSRNPGLVVNPDEATKGYYIQQIMLRIKDPRASLDFYSRVLGMRLLKRLDVAVHEFSVYLMGYESPALAPNDPVHRAVWTLSQKPVVELKHNWGTENDPDFKGYHNGNSDPLGFGHIGIVVNDLYKACERFEHLGVECVPKADDGKGITFIKDPDGYWVEIIDIKRVTETIAYFA